MIVYEFRHTIYVWEDCDTTVHTLLFETEEDAIEYLETKKTDIIDEYCKQLNLPYSIDELRQYMNGNTDTYDELDDEEGYFRIELEEYGVDTLSIEKKEVLKFK